MDERFVLVGPRTPVLPPSRRKKWYEGKPLLSMALLAVILLGCLGCELFMPKDPVYMDLFHAVQAPDSEFWFGTDTMGRDIFSMIWYGGRASLLIGALATAISTALAVLFGAVSGLAPGWLDGLLMRLTEIFLSIPSLLLIILLQAVLGKASVASLSLVIGVTGWTGMAKVVCSEVRRLRSSEYVLAAKCMGAGFFHVLGRHLAPNFFSSIMFMVVMNVRSAIAAESTLSFMGLGLPLEIISWGSMLSLAEKALLSGAWWIILIPGAFLVATLLCVTNIGNWLRGEGDRRESNL
ncbi:MAG: ABC transporter permease [Oscillospiraceae bacterium]|nr:ABC transporter permease [Oscillospiraceae bacterium]